MARPGAEILLSVDTEDNGSMEVLHSRGVWVLAYAGVPCALKERYYAADGEHIKYPRTGFNNHAHCERLAEKMNNMFKTNKFTCMEVVKYIGGKTMVRRLTSE